MGISFGRWWAWSVRQKTVSFLCWLLSGPTFWSASTKAISSHSLSSPPRTYCSRVFTSTWHFLVFAFSSQSLLRRIRRASCDMNPAPLGNSIISPLFPFTLSGPSSLPDPGVESCSASPGGPEEVVSGLLRWPFESGVSMETPGESGVPEALAGTEVCFSFNCASSWLILSKARFRFLNTSACPVGSGCAGEGVGTASVIFSLPSSRAFKAFLTGEFFSSETGTVRFTSCFSLGVVFCVQVGQGGAETTSAIDFDRYIWNIVEQLFEVN